MIQLAPQMRILVAVKPVDFRKGIDGLSQLCRRVLKEDPFSGTVFVFRNGKCTSVKVLVYDGQGYWLCQKRLSKGRFRWLSRQEGGIYEVKEYLAREVQALLWNGDPTKMGEGWREIGGGKRIEGQ